MEQKPNNEIEERNATLDEETPKITDDEGKLQEELLEESGMNAFQKFIARMDDHTWTVAQWITGAVMGVIAAVALFWDTIAAKTTEETSSSGGIFTIPLVIAIVVALIVPNIIEKQGMRRAPKLRVALVIALLVAIVAYVAVTALTKGF